MKRLTTFLMALMLTWIGANAQTDYSYLMSTDGTTGWTNASAMDWGVERYGFTSAGKVMYQTIENLPAGTYTVKFYAFSRIARDNALPTADTQSTISQGYAQAGDNAAVTQALTIPTTYTPDHVGFTASDMVTLTVTLAEGESLEYGIQNATAGGQWYGVSAISLISNATPEAKSIAAGDVVEEEEAEGDHWKIVGSGEGALVNQLKLNTWSAEADASGMVVPFVQYWRGAGNELSASTISHYQLGGLPAGYYSVSIFARAFNEVGSDGAATADIADETIFFTANEESIDLTTGTHGDYNGGADDYGTYELLAEVTSAGTLDIGFTIAEDSNCDWLAWKNLYVEYIGESIPYTISEPECSATVVQPGSEVTITFAECLSPGTDETPTLDSDKSIIVNGTEVTGTIESTGLTTTVTFTLPESIGDGATITVEVPEGLIYWEVTGGENVLSPAGEFTLYTPATIDDGDYLIMNSDGYYLGGGLTWGTEATLLGKPQFIGFEVQENGTYHLDSHQYNNATAHYLGSNLYFDNDTPVDWTLVKVENGYELFDADANRYVTGNGFQELVTLSTDPYVWTLVTMEDVVASMADATEDAPVDVTALIKAPELKRNSNNTTYYQTWTVTGYDGTGTPSNYAFGGGSAVANCAESYHSSNGFNFSQEITLPLAGYYTLSAKGFYRDDNSTTLLLPVMYAGEKTSTFPELETEASTMATAYAEFLEGLHQIEAIGIVAEEDGETVTIGFKGEDTSLWQIMGELDLQYYGVVEETIEWEMTSAGWGTLILPFAAEVPEGLTAYSCSGLESDGETLSLTVASTLASCTPYIVKGDADTYSFTGTPENTKDKCQVGLLVGTLVDMTQDDFTADGTEYVLQYHVDETTGEEVDDGLAFYPITSESEGVTLDANHCYLNTGTAVTALHLPGMETGIVAVEGAETLANDAIYDLSGRKVSKAVKGVYIQNGKKVLVK